MKKHSLYSYISLAVIIGWLQSGNVVCAQPDTPGAWVRSVGGELMDLAKSVSTDNEGNVYVTGGFQGASYFGSEKLQANGDTDFFIAKYDNAGALLWVKSAGSDTVQRQDVLSEYGADIVVDRKYVYVTGMFSGSSKFGNTAIRSQGDNDIFLAKYTLNGELVWVRSAGGRSQDIAHAIAMDEQGNIYITGLFQGIARFGQHAATSPNSAAFFLAKYDANGNVQWIKQSEGDRAAEGKDLVIKDDQCFVIGSIEGATAFDGVKVKAGQPSVFMNRYTLAGSLKSARSLATGAALSVEGIQADRRAVYIAGSAYGPLQAGDKTYDGAGGTDGFLIKTDNQSNIQWVKTFGGPGVDIIKKVCMTDDKQVIVGGTFNAYMKMDTTLLATHGGDDIFVASCTALGHVNWVDRLGGELQDNLSDIALHAGYITLAGHFTGTFSYRGQQQQTAGQTDVLLVSMPLSTTPGYTPETGEGVAFYPNPANDAITVESSESINRLSIVDISGRVFKEIELDGVYEVQISVREIPAGLYVIKTNSPKGIRTSKLVVKR